MKGHACAACKNANATLRKKDNAGKEKYFCNETCFKNQKKKDDEAGVCEFC